MIPSIALRTVSRLGIPSAALCAKARAVGATRATVAAVQPLIDAQRRQALLEGGYQVAAHWVELGCPGGAITDPAQAYELSELDLESYAARCSALHRAAGYAFPQGQCPLEIARHEQSLAEIAFGLGCRELNTGIDPEEARGGLDTWEEFLGVMLRYVEPFAAQK